MDLAERLLFAVRCVNSPERETLRQREEERRPKAGRTPMAVTSSVPPYQPGRCEDVLHGVTRTPAWRAGSPRSPGGPPLETFHQHASPAALQGRRAGSLGVRIQAASLITHLSKPSPGGRDARPASPLGPCWRRNLYTTLGSHTAIPDHPPGPHGRGRYPPCPCVNA